MIRRILAFIGVLSLLAAGVWASPLTLPKFYVGELVDSNQIDVKPRDLSLVCPGPVVRAGGASGTELGVLDRVGLAKVQGRFGSQVDSISGRQIGSESANLNGPSVAFDSSKPYVFEAADESGEIAQGSAMSTASQTQLVSNARIRGLVGAACQKPSSEFWLIGGDTTTGRESLLLLTNPSKVDATVNLQLLSTEGELKISGLTAISVPHEDTVIIPISALAPKLSTFAVHVQSTGGALAGWLQQKAVRGTSAAGVDFIAPVADASKSLVIPGFLVRGVKDAAALKKADPDFADLTNVLRVTNPGNEPAEITAQVTGSDSKTFGTVLQATVAPRSTVDLEIKGLADGDYAIFIESSVKILAAAKLNRTNKTAAVVTDFTWLPSVDPKAGPRVITVPAAGISKLAIANPTDETIEYSVNGGGLAANLKLAPGALVSLLVTSGAVSITASEPGLAATLIVDVDATIAAIPMVEYQNLGGLISVIIR
ncbi:MAG: hypothetical protein RIR46_169 [Actinomycetota bacterium]|jgi:hypothetical protein